MKVTINQDECIGCSLCAQISEDVFEMEGDVAVVKSEQAQESQVDNVKAAAQSCPVDAIIINE